MAPLTPDERQAFITGCRHIKLKKGERLLEVGGTYGAYYFISAGFIRVETLSEQKQLVTCGFEMVNGILGELNLEARYTSTIAASAALESVVHVVPTFRLRSLVRNNPDVGLALISHTAVSVQKLRKQLARLNHASPEIAVGKSMYELGEDQGAGRLMDRRLTQTMLAPSMGMSREKFNQTVRTLEEKGLVKKTENGYLVDKLFASTDYSVLMPTPSN